MSADTYIAELKEANPRLFSAVKIQMTTSAFEAQLRRAYQTGREDFRRQLNASRPECPDFLRDLVR